MPSYRASLIPLHPSTHQAMQQLPSSLPLQDSACSGANPTWATAMVLSTSTSQLPGPAASAVQSGGCGGAASRLASNMPTTTQQAVGAAAAVEPFCHDSLQADLAFLEAVLKGNAFRPPPVLDCRPSVTGFLAGQGALGALGGGAPPQPQLSATGCGPLGDLLRLGRSAPTPYLPSAGSSGPAALHSQLQASMDGSAPRGTTSPQQRQQQQQQLQQLLHSSGQVGP